MCGIGPTNKKLRCQLPLVVPEGGCCQLRVADDIITLEEGKVSQRRREGER